jgi:hypothetical protein
MKTTTTQDGYRVTVRECDSTMGDFVAYARGENWTADMVSEQAYSGTEAGAVHAVLHLARAEWTYNHTCPVCYTMAPKCYDDEVSPSWECTVCAKSEVAP